LLTHMWVGLPDAPTEAARQHISFRESCREGVCGSDAMSINGRNGLACITPVRSLKGEVVLRPLPSFPIIRDLVVDMTNFFEQYHSVKPWVENPELPPEKERLQSPAERERLNGAYECILCGCCSSQCPSYWWNPDKFVGPAGLLQAYRFIVDSRDKVTDDRFENLRGPFSPVSLPHRHELRRTLSKGAETFACHREDSIADAERQRLG
jgi:succinate dehydrogenase / fumarate reductase iron-sulfur subunit